MQLRGANRLSAAVNVLDENQLGSGKRAGGSFPRHSVIHKQHEQPARFSGLSVGNSPRGSGLSINADGSPRGSVRKSQEGHVPEWVAAQKRRLTQQEKQREAQRQSIPEHGTAHVHTLTLGGFGGGDSLRAASGQLTGHAMHKAIGGGRLSSMGIKRNTLLANGMPGRDSLTKRGIGLPRYVFGSEDVDDYSHVDGSRNHQDAHTQQQQSATPKQWVPPPPSAINRSNDLLEEDHLRIIMGEMDSEFMTKVQAAAEAISALFEEADFDADGFVSYHDIKAVFRKISYNLAEDVDKHLPEDLRHADAKINHDRFVAAFIPLAMSVPEEVIIARVPTDGPRRGSAMPDTQGTRRTLLGFAPLVLPALSEGAPVPTTRRASRQITRKSTISGLKLGSTVRTPVPEGETPETARDKTEEGDKVVEVTRRSVKKRTTVLRKDDMDPSALTTSDRRRSFMDAIDGNSSPIQ